MIDVNYDAKVTAEKGNTVNMRSNPSINASVIKAIRIGTVVHVVGEDDSGWSKIETDGTTGYMMSKFLQKINGGNETDDDTIVVVLSKEAARELFAALGTSLGV